MHKKKKKKKKNGRCLETSLNRVSVSQLTLRRTKQAWMPPPPLIVFPDVFKTIYCQLMPSSVAVQLSLRHILVKFSDNRLLW